MITDAVATHIIEGVVTIATVIISGLFNRHTTRYESKKIHKRFDAMVTQIGRPIQEYADIPISLTKIYGKQPNLPI